MIGVLNDITKIIWYFEPRVNISWVQNTMWCPYMQKKNHIRGHIINILPLVEGVTVDYHRKKKYHPRQKSRVIFFLSVVIYCNTLNQRQYVLYYIECPSEGGIAGCGISLQHHPLLWWARLSKVREKYNIYIYQWNCQIIKEICIMYNIINYQSEKNYKYSKDCICGVMVSVLVSSVVDRRFKPW